MSKQPLNLQFRIYAPREIMYDSQSPELHLSGQWLEGLGFQTGKLVNISISGKVLIIEVVENECEEESSKINQGF